ncbi:MAG: hypothetical protein WBP12_05345 [Candidatus Saccharimonas sp.]
MSDESYPALVGPDVINLNWWIKMCLTSHGRELLDKYNTYIGREVLGRSYDAEIIESNGMYRFQLYMAVHIFGGAGMPESILIADDRTIFTEKENWTWQALNLQQHSQVLLTPDGEERYGEYLANHDSVGVVDTVQAYDESINTRLSQVPLRTLFEIFSGSMPSITTMSGLPFWPNITIQAS